MKKIMKRLLTGLLALTAIITALPTTQVQAAEQVYTERKGQADKIVKVDNAGNEVSSFTESIMDADGEAYCVDINTGFEDGYKTRHDASSKMTEEQITDVALSLEYVKQYAKDKGLSYNQTYLLKQCIVWCRLSVYLGWGYNNVRAPMMKCPKKSRPKYMHSQRLLLRKTKTGTTAAVISTPVTGRI